LKDFQRKHLHYQKCVFSTFFLFAADENHKPPVCRTGLPGYILAESIPWN
jgi:hypothetical protein